jgi:broad specificity phosphatase PhoE
MGNAAEHSGRNALTHQGVGGREEGRNVLSLYLLRHGETAFSHHNRFCGRIDAPLTHEGREMAAAFAGAYAAVPWTGIVTSSRTRTIDTATPIAARVGVELRRDERLDEMSYGDWQGLSKAEAAARDPEHFARWLQDPSIGAPRGELPDDVAARALRAIGDVRDRHPHGNVLVVSHKAVLRIVLCRLLRLDLREYRSIDWPVAAVTRVDLEDDRVSLHTFADVSHLTGARPEPIDEQPAASLTGADGPLAAMTG